MAGPQQRLHHTLRQLQPCRAATAPTPAPLPPVGVDIVDVSAWVNQEACGPAADDSRAIAVTSMSRSLHRSGLCLIVGHGVSAALQRRVYAAALHFFHQPRHVKERFASRQKGTPGWMAAGQQRLGQTLSRKTLPADLNEFLIFSTAFEGHPDAKNLGDSAAVVPTVPAELPALFNEYTAAMKRLNLALMRLTATALGESEQFFEQFFDPGQYTLQMRYYEATPPGFAPAPGQMRIGAHADSNGFTIVRLDGQPGLQVRLQDSDNAAQRWVDVSGGPECLVVNTGRMVERWTGGHFKAAVHRVLATRHSTAESSDDATAAGCEERLSLAFFSSPNKTALIKTVGPSVGSSSAHLYPPIVAGDLSDAHYVAAYSDGVDEEGRAVAPNEALAALGERQID